MAHQNAKAPEVPPSKTRTRYFSVAVFGTFVNDPYRVSTIFGSHTLVSLNPMLDSHRQIKLIIAKYYEDKHPGMKANVFIMADCGLVDPNTVPDASAPYEFFVEAIGLGSGKTEQRTVKIVGPHAFYHGTDAFCHKLKDALPSGWSWIITDVYAA